jgi:hypothetical protein
MSLGFVVHVSVERSTHIRQSAVMIGILFSVALAVASRRDQREEIKHHRLEGPDTALRW